MCEERLSDSWRVKGSSPLVYLVSFVYLVHLVYFVYLVYLVCFVNLVYLVDLV